ncbi:class I SAM-dependent methyltransferase [Paenibacillus senegalensis]|uniref:class I SAM-dependent methyltransferase n=1 Tax=Paenibacillus senegalensis TaxID=1465766 RepID=UPI00028A2853|nr:class I SAM-dependent methyltransferase [Paenibacillus senegalensis]
MQPNGNNPHNVDRFNGFQEDYDRHRPTAPSRVAHFITHYLQRTPRLVLDVGCGTGLSSFIWKGYAGQIVGIEPNAGMLAKAKDKWEREGKPVSIAFREGYSNALDIPSGSADVITCSQSFHWMEPVSTLREFARVLSDGGVFAAYDCDWPPSSSWRVETSYLQLMQHADQLIDQLVSKEEQAVKRNKEEHLQRIRESGHFRFTKEIVFHNEESCTADRYIGLALSQGGVQTALKLGANELQDALETFRREVEEYFQQQTLTVAFGYRMRIGIK